MHALTIQQPFAALIAGGPGIYKGELKRIENRGHHTSFRGPLLIHAGVSRKWLPDGVGYDSQPRELHFGAIVAKAKLVECLSLDWLHDPGATADDPRLAKYGWVGRNQHAEGPYCWILENVQRLEVPVPYRGQQGIFQAKNLDAARWKLLPPHLGCEDQDAAVCAVCGCTQRHACWEEFSEQTCTWIDLRTRAAVPGRHGGPLCDFCAADLIKFHEQSEGRA